MANAPIGMTLTPLQSQVAPGSSTSTVLIGSRCSYLLRATSQHSRSSTCSRNGVAIHKATPSASANLNLGINVVGYLTRDERTQRAPRVAYRLPGWRSGLGRRSNALR